MCTSAARFISLLAVSLLLTAAAQATLLETWESQPNTNPFTGTGDLTWTGDVGGFEITTATWPTSPAPDFAGNHSLRSLTTTAHDSRTVVTDISSEFNLQAVTWSVFVSGNSADITGTSTMRDFSLILMSDSSSAAAIEGGIMNGYRVRVGDATGGGSNDSIFFEEANNGGSWSILQESSLGVSSRNVNEGWNLLVTRTTGGVFSYGFSNGTIGTPTTLSYSFTDPTVTSASYAGMMWRAPGGATTPFGESNDFGFDNFLVAGVPEPSMLALLGLGGLLAWRRRR